MPAPEPPLRPWVIYLSAIPWRWESHRQQELARQLARTRRVLFVEPPGLRPAWRLRAERLAPSLWRVSPPALLPLGRFIPPANALNRRFAARRLRGWLDQRPGSRLLLVDEDLSAPMIGRLGETARVYDAADLDWTFTRRWNRWHLRRALQAAVRRSDLVVVSSPALAEALPVNGKAPVELLNACDPGHFTPQGAEAPLLGSVPRPRVGYVGAIDERAFDAPLVAAVARLRPEWSLVLVGRPSAAAVAELAELPNVHLIGPVPHADVPAFVRGFDVCLIPYRVDGRIRYVHPKKLYEYLAAGKHVVATPLPSLATSDAPHRIARTPEEFVAAVTAALADSRSAELAERQREVAAANSWDARGEALTALLDELDAEAA